MASCMISCALLALSLMSSCGGRLLPTYYGSPFLSSDEEDVPPTTASLHDVHESLASLLENITALNGDVSTLHGTFNAHQVNYTTLQEVVSTVTEILGQVGAIYTRWGRGTCGVGSILLYDGFTAGSFYSTQGGGADYLCLPPQPQYDQFRPGFQQAGNLHIADLQTSGYFEPFGSAQGATPKCAVCRTTGRSSVLMIPAWTSCPNEMMKEYQGHLMTAHNMDQRTKHICVDKDVETVSGTEGGPNGARLHFTETSNNELPHPPFVRERELTCVVCSM